MTCKPETWQILAYNGKNINQKYCNQEQLAPSYPIYSCYARYVNLNKFVLFQLVFALLIELAYYAFQGKSWPLR